MKSIEHYVAMADDEMALLDATPNESLCAGRTPLRSEGQGSNCDGSRISAQVRCLGRRSTVSACYCR